MRARPMRCVRQQFEAPALRTRSGWPSTSSTGWPVNATLGLPGSETEAVDAFFATLGLRR